MNRYLTGSLIIQNRKMISHQHRCIFIHIPKCAGTSIENVLGHHEGHKGIGAQDHRPLRWIEPFGFKTDVLFNQSNLRECWRRFRYQLKSVKNYRNKYTVTPEQYESYFKFSIVRNPWARIFSWYKGTARNEDTKKMYGIKGDPDFKEFFYENVGTGYLRPQRYWLKSFNGLYPYDFIGKFENLDKDFQKICDAIGIEKRSLPHKLPGSGQDYREFYDKKMIKKVNEICAEEIKRFEYSFDNNL